MREDVASAGWPIEENARTHRGGGDYIDAAVGQLDAVRQAHVGQCLDAHVMCSLVYCLRN